ncbi:MAG: tetratricopeptide repeat protein [Armatimonadetes bacterium]|nr:tetratricopeptide repeat protein [Armatimonadota bacterium]
MRIRILPAPPEVFLGRGQQLLRLRGLLAERRLLVLEGLPGVGKTSLALALANAVSDERPVGWCACREGWSLRSLLREASEWFGAEPQAEPPGTDLAEALVHLVHRLNQGRCALFVDDVHLLAPELLVTLLENARLYLREANLVLITARRPPLSPLELVDLCEVRLEGLDTPDGAALLARILDGAWGRPEVMTRISERLSGHPLLLKMFAALVQEGLARPEDLLADVPSLAREVLTRALQDLSAEELDCLQALSLAREPLRPEALSDPEAVRHLHRRFLVTRCPAGYQSPALVRETLARSLSEEVRRGLHAGLAGRLEDLLRRGYAAALAREVLFHHAQAGQLDRVERILLEHGGSLCSQGYYEDVLTCAAQPDSPPQLIVLRANVLSILGRWAEAMELLADLAARAGRPQERAEALTALAGAYLNTGRLSDALECYHTARAAAPGSLPALKALNYLTFIYAFRGQREEADRHADLAEQLALELGNRAGSAHCLRMRGVALLERGRFTQALEVSQECLERARELGAARLTCWALVNQAGALAGLGRRDEALAAVTRSLESARCSRDTQVEAFCHLILGELERDAGALDSALQSVARAREAFGCQGNRLGQSRAAFDQAQLLVEAGRLSEAERLLGDCLTASLHYGHYLLEARAREALAWLHLQRGELEEAAALARDHLARLGELLAPERLAEAHLILAECAYRRAGSRGGDWQTPEHLRQALELSRDVPAASVRALLLSAWLSPEPDSVRADHAGRARGLMEGLSGRLARQALAYQDRLARLMLRRFVVKTVERELVVGVEELESLRARRDDYALWIDFPARCVWERTRGEVDLMGRPILSALLLQLVRHTERRLTQEELFTAVWGYPYDPHQSPGELRKNISRLRNLLEPDRHSEQFAYIRLCPGLMKEKGRYYFAGSSFCLIEELETASD